MSSWQTDGNLTTIARVSAVSTPAGSKDVAVALGAFTRTGGKFASDGVVNSNTATRIQTDLTMPEAVALYAPRGIAAVASMGITQADIDALSNESLPGQTYYFDMTLYITPATAVPTTPTIAQIKAAATFTSRSAAGSRVYASSGPGPITRVFDNVGPLPSQLSPNTKYWAAYMMTWNVDGFIGNVPPGTPASTERAISFWTNRPPNAPTISSPASGTVVNSGSAFTFSYTPNDPDAVTGSVASVFRPWSFLDLAGVQVQYAEPPTLQNPEPVWQDLPIGSTDAVPVMGRGWFIDGSIDEPANDGARVLRDARQISVRGGRTVGDPGEGVLPAGSWLLRCRTFDYGHPHSTVFDARNATPYTVGWGALGVPIVNSPAPGSGDVTPETPSTPWTPDTFPDANKSPWSTPVAVVVTEQVPAPVPVAPVNSQAVVESQSIQFLWRYRNTHVPAYAQKTRTIEIRAVGDSEWITVVSGNSSASNYSWADHGLTPGRRYEWRVKVTDTDDVASRYSEVSSFWLVAAPASGPVIPLPEDTTEGATLGCGTHRVFVYRRGGRDRVGEITGISGVEWSRKRDDISLAKIEVSGWDIDCGNLLAMLQCWAYEIVIFRDNGFTEDRVWEGPITLLTYEKDSVTIQAKDVMAYLYRRIIRQAMSDAGNGDTVTSRAARVIQNCLAPDDPNVLPYLQILTRDDDARQYRSLPAYSRTGFEEVDDMAANAGLDYTAVGRAILVWGTKHRIGTLPEFRDSDLGSPPIVSEYGMSMANVYVVSDGNGIYGQADRLNDDGEDPIYGLVEVLSSTWASDSATDTGAYTPAGLATIKQSFEESAERSIGDRYPPPVVVRVPDNTRLNADTVLSIQHLVPGVVIPLRSTGTLRTVVATQKLDSVMVKETAGEESITITLSPFSRDDNAPGEEVDA